MGAKISFGNEIKYGEGYSNSSASTIIPVGDGYKIIAIHNQLNHQNNDGIYYTIGTLQSDDTINFSPAVKFADCKQWLFLTTVKDDSTNYGYKIIQANGDDEAASLFYRIGTFDKDAINFTAPIEYASKNSDCLSMAVIPAKKTNKIIEVHDDFISAELFYNVGELGKNNIINFSKSPIQYGTGLHQVCIVAMPFKDSYILIEAHNFGNTFYSVGELQSDDTIKFRNSIRYDGSVSVNAIAILPDSKILEIHCRYEDSTLFYRLGKLDAEDYTIKFEDPVEYGTGYSANVSACQTRGETKIIETHVDDNNCLFYRIGTLEYT